jgi:hypothetical protein
MQLARNDNHCGFAVLDDSLGALFERAFHHFAEMAFRFLNCQTLVMGNRLKSTVANLDRISQEVARARVHGVSIAQEDCASLAFL